MGFGGLGLWGFRVFGVSVLGFRDTPKLISTSTPELILKDSSILPGPPVNAQKRKLYAA